MGLFVSTVSADVFVLELGLKFTHPTVDYDLSGQFTGVEIARADSLTTAIRNGSLVWKQTAGGSAEVATDYDPEFLLADSLGTGIGKDSYELVKVFGTLSHGKTPTWNSLTSRWEPKVGGYPGGPVTNAIYVAKSGDDTNGDGSYSNPYLTIAKALSMVTSPSETNRWLIYVMPGIYLEVLLTVPDFTSVVGTSIGSVVIEPDTANHHIFNLGNNCEVSFLTARNAGTGYAAFTSTSLITDEWFLLHKVSIYDCDIGILVDAASADAEAYAEYVDINGTYSYAVKCLASPTYFSFLNLENFYTYPDSVLGTSQIKCSGAGSELIMLAGEINGDGSDTAVEVDDGALLSIASMIFKDSDTSVYVPAAGTAPTMYIDASFASVTNNLNIQNTGCFGSFTGVADRDKIINLSPVGFQLVYRDPLDGDLNVSRNTATRGFVTELQTIVSASQTTQLVSTDPFVCVITGSTLGQIIRLPDATTLRNGHQFWILNESSVAVTMQNYGGTVPIVVAANSNAKRILLDNSTQAGVWNVSLSASWLTGKLRDPRQFKMNGTVGNGNWITIDELLPDYKYVFTEPVKMIGMEWSNGGGTGRDFDLEFYKNGILAGNLIRTYQVRNSTYDYGSAIGWDNEFAAGDWMRVKYVDQGDNVSDFGGRFNFEVLT